MQGAVEQGRCRQTGPPASRRRGRTTRRRRRSSTCAGRDRTMRAARLEDPCDHDSADERFRHERGQHQQQPVLPVALPGLDLLRARVADACVRPLHAINHRRELRGRHRRDRGALPDRRSRRPGGRRSSVRYTPGFLPRAGWQPRRRHNHAGRRAHPHVSHRFDHERHVRRIQRKVVPSAIEIGRKQDDAPPPFATLEERRAPVGETRRTSASRSARRATHARIAPGRGWRRARRTLGRSDAGGPSRRASSNQPPAPSRPAPASSRTSSRARSARRRSIAATNSPPPPRTKAASPSRARRSIPRVDSRTTASCPTRSSARQLRRGTRPNVRVVEGRRKRPRRVESGIRAAGVHEHHRRPRRRLENDEPRSSPENPAGSSIETASEPAAGARYATITSLVDPAGTMAADAATTRPSRSTRTSPVHGALPVVADRHDRRDPMSTRIVVTATLPAGAPASRTSTVRFAGSGARTSPFPPRALQIGHDNEPRRITSRDVRRLAQHRRVACGALTRRDRRERRVRLGWSARFAEHVGTVVERDERDLLVRRPSRRWRVTRGRPPGRTSLARSC